VATAELQQEAGHAPIRAILVGVLAVMLTFLGLTVSSAGASKPKAVTITITIGPGQWDAGKDLLA